MVSLDQVKHLERPSRALFTVYLVRAIGVAIGILLALGFIALRAGGDALSKLAEHARRSDVPLVAIVAALFLIAYVIAAFGFYVRFRTLRYRFDEDGLTRQTGLLFRHESFLAYARIQDARVTQGVVERLFGLGTVAIQTASGTKGLEESVEGMREFELIRDFLVERMKGGTATTKSAKPTASVASEELALVNEIRDEMRSLRVAVEGRR
jgi:putative membrane protein